MAVENLAKPSIQKALKPILKSIADSLPDEDLIKVHKEGLQASEKVFSKEGELLSEKPDYGVRHKYLDSAYKIKGSYAPEKILQRTNVSFGNLDLLSNEELAKLIGE